MQTDERVEEYGYGWTIYVCETLEILSATQWYGKWVDRRIVNRRRTMMFDRMYARMWHLRIWIEIRDSDASLNILQVRARTTALQSIDGRTFSSSSYYYYYYIADIVVAVVVFVVIFGANYYMVQFFLYSISFHQSVVCPRRHRRLLLLFFFFCCWCRCENVFWCRAHLCCQKTHGFIKYDSIEKK